MLSWMHASRLLTSHKTFISSQLIQSRGFYRIFVAITNRPDKERIKEVGPNRACAEWLLRCGATVKLKGANRFQADYNLLPAVNTGSFIIEEVEAIEAGIMFVGFDHFEGCNDIRRVKIHHCPYFDDDSLGLMIDKLKTSLERLELTSCGDISDDGLKSIGRLSQLRKLLLMDLPEIRDKNGCYEHLKRSLSVSCAIDYKDLSA